MNNDNKIFRLSKLDKGKVKGIRFLEGIRLKIIGHIDGNRNLPRQGADGRWTSPNIEREIKSYDEFTSRLWGHLQIEKEEGYARLGELMDAIGKTKNELETVELDLSDAISREEGFNSLRMHGEDRLTDLQVHTRREKEKEKRLTPLRSRVNALKNKLNSEVEEFSALRNEIIEENNSTRMICSRVKDHLLQRLNLYWDYALRNHADKELMPVAICVEISSRAEAIYNQPHEELMRRADLLSQSFSDKEEEEV